MVGTCGTSCCTAPGRQPAAVVRSRWGGVGTGSEIGRRAPGGCGRGARASLENGVLPGGGGRKGACEGRRSIPACPGSRDAVRRRARPLRHSFGLCRSGRMLASDHPCPLGPGRRAVCFATRATGRGKGRSPLVLETGLLFCTKRNAGSDPGRGRPRRRQRPSFGRGAPSRDLSQPRKRSRVQARPPARLGGALVGEHLREASAGPERRAPRTAVSVVSSSVAISA